MDLNDIIRKLHTERVRVNQIIASLEKLQRSVPQPEAAPRPKRRGRRFMDEAGRLEVSERMKKYWAGRRTKKDDTPPMGV
jgi:hypothetical protein